MGKQIINGDVEITGQLLKGDLKALYHLGAYDSVDTTNADYDLVTRNGWYRNVSQWIIEHQDELNFRATSNGYELGKDGGSGLFPSPYVSSGSLMTGVCNQLFQFGTDDSAWANTSEYWLNPNWVSLPNTYTTKAQYIEFFSTHEIIVEYKISAPYTEKVLKNQPLSTLDQNGENWLRGEYEKQLNLFSFETPTSLVQNGITISVAQDGSITMSGTASSSGNFYIPIKNNYYKGTHTATFVVLNGSISFDYIAFYLKNSSDAIQLQWDGSMPALTKTVPLDSSITYMQIFVVSGTSVNAKIGIMLTKTNYAVPWQPYNGPVMHAIDVEGVKLWENGNPNSSFASQTISLSDMSGYKRLRFVFKRVFDNYVVPNILETNIGFGDIYLNTVLRGVVYSREVHILNYTSIQFADGYEGTTSNNNACIPVAIYGIK